jgi:hypothetical protein
MSVSRVSRCAVRAWNRDRSGADDGGNYTFETGLEAGRVLFAAEARPSAIFSSNDEMAAGIVHAAHEAGLEVPGDVSLVGFDDTPIAAHMWPPLTTVRWPIKAMAHSAALKLIHPERAAQEVAFLNRKRFTGLRSFLSKCDLLVHMMDSFRVCVRWLTPVTQSG